MKIQVLKKIPNRLVWLSFVTLSGLIFLSNSSNPPNGRTGAPGDGLCTNCHAQSAAINGSVNISGLPSEIEMGASYDIIVTSVYTLGNPTRAGFQLVALDGSNNNIGTFSNPGSDVDFETSGGRTYTEHRPAKFFGSASNELSYQFTWTAPTSTTSDQVTFYVASVLANGNGNSAGDRTVTSTQSATIMQLSSPLELELSATAVSCFDGTDGQIVANVSGGDGPYQYIWSTGATTASIENLSPGTYSLTVNDAAGQTISASATVDNVPPIEAAIVGNNTITCIESSVTLEVSVQGGATPYQFLWSSGAVTQSVNVTQAGLIAVTVTDGNGCTQEASLDVIDISEEIAVLLEDEFTITCFGDVITVQAAGPTGPNYVYQWSTLDGSILSPSNESTILVDIPAVYELTVINTMNGCVTSVSTTVVGSQNPITVSETILNPSCFQNNDGSIAIEVSGGTAPYTYQWSEGSNSSSLENIPAGSYEVSVTDALGCQATGTFELFHPGPLAIQLSVSQISAFGLEDGAASAQVSGGTEPYTYEWLGQNQTGPELTDLGPGTYTLIVTDAQGCTAQANAIIQIFGCDLEAEIVIVQPISCHGASDGAIALSIASGDAPFTVSWSNGSDEFLLTELSAGIYSVSVSDASGCNLESVIELQEPDPIIVTPQISNESSLEAMDGSVTLLVTGGTAPYSVLWSNEVDLFSQEDLAPGDYGYTITDSRGCSFMGEITIQPFVCALVLDSLIQSDVSCFGGSDGMVTIQLSNADGDLTIEWNNGFDQLSADDLSAGEYEVTITDALNCILSFSFDIGQPQALLIQTIDYSAIITSENTGFIEIEVNGGTAPYTYSWTKDGVPFGNNAALLTDLSAGIYQATVIDENACQILSDTFVIELKTSFQTRDEENQIVLFPNPGTNLVFLELTSSYEHLDWEIQMHTIQGGLIKTWQSKASGFAELDVSSIPSGVYIFRISNSQGYTKNVRWSKL